MNKKIKVIELLNKIANGEEVPKKIKSEDKEFYFQEDEASIDYLYRTDKNGNGWLVVQDLALNDEVEILEDNTEEIEEKSNFENMGYEIAQAYFEFYKGIAKALTEKRKESEGKQ